MAQHVFKGSGAPTSIPSKLSQHYIDETAEEHYISVDTTSSADWQKQSKDGHGHAASDVSDFDTEVGNHTDVAANTTHRGVSSGNPHSVSKSDVSLGNVDDLQQIPLSQKGAASGVATLDGSSKVPSAQLPSYVDDVEEYANQAAFPGTGESGKIYVALDTLKTYRWTGTVYAEISPSDVNSVGGYTGVVTAAQLKTAYESNADTNEFSDAEQTKLAGIESAATADQSNAEIKTAYEANANTNEFSDAEQTKLTGIAPGATANDTDANLKARANHTGSQTKSTISDFAHGMGGASHSADTLANLNSKISDATLIDTGDSRLSDSRPCDNTFDSAPTARTNLDVYSTSEVDGKVVGLYEHKGAYNAATNTPDLDTTPITINKGDAYTVSAAGTFFTESVEIGDVLISDQDSPTLLTHWTRVNKNISFGSSAGTACEGDDARLSDARTPTSHTHVEADVTDLHTHSNKAVLDAITASFLTADETKLDAIEANATADQSNAEIKTAYEANANTNEFSDAEQTKLVGIATGATQNDTDANLKARANHTGSQLKSTISDYDTELAGKTNVTSFTPSADYHPATKKYVDDSVGGGGYCATVCFAETLPYAQVTSSSYSKVGSFPFPGTTAVGSPIECIIASYLNAGTDMDIRIYDVTNAQTICELIDQSNGTVALVDLGTLSNLPANAAIFEIHLLATGSGPKARIESLILR